MCKKRMRLIRKYKKLHVALRSPFWIENDEKLRNVSAREKIVSEFAFTVEANKEKKG